MDDFSFPTIQTDQDSPTNQVFWFYRRSFSSAGEASKVADSLTRSALSDEDEGARDRFVESEEKMDMLWEDFNEELHRVSCEWNRDLKGRTGTVACASDVEFGVSRRRRPGLVAMLKVLKKLFLVQRRSSAKRVPPIYKI